MCYSRSGWEEGGYDNGKCANFPLDGDCASFSSSCCCFLHHLCHFIFRGRHSFSALLATTLFHFLTLNCLKYYTFKRAYSREVWWYLVPIKIGQKKTIWQPRRSTPTTMFLRFRYFQYCYSNFSSIEDVEKCPNRGGLKNNLNNLFFTSFWIPNLNTRNIGRKKFRDHKCVLYSSYYVTYMRFEEIEEAPSSSRGEKKDLDQIPFL
jgi:hypothetical protein